MLTMTDLFEPDMDDPEVRLKMDKRLRLNKGFLFKRKPKKSDKPCPDCGRYWIHTGTRDEKCPECREDRK